MRDVTKLVEFGNNDDETLPIKKCVCGTKFPEWSFYISIYPDHAEPCPNCGRKLYFQNTIVVWEI